MATIKSMRVLFAILVISAWVLGSAIQARAETMNYRSYSYVLKAEDVPVGDMGRTLARLRRARVRLTFSTLRSSTPSGTPQGRG